ncbi:MAG: hypothetical protein LBN00_03310 [Oscillospiraceae bacterium]|nr:hypothetical protein [Oscillospiraceae bacterium]
MSRAAKEKIKTALIAVLLVTAVLLAQFTGIFGELTEGFKRAPAGGASAPIDDGTVSVEAARPTVIVVTDAAGARAVAKYDSAAVDTVYERTVSLMGEALSSADEIRRCPEDEWRQALSRSNVMFEYYNAAPLELIGKWLGAQNGFDVGELPVSRLCFAWGGSKLYFQSGDGFYRAETASLGGEVSVAGEYRAENAYQFELDADSSAPYLILTADAHHPTLITSNPFERTENTTAILAAFGVDGTQKAGYTESDGTQVYVSNVFTVSVSTDGILTYHRSAATNDSNAIGVVDGVELARVAAQRVLDAYSGDARVRFSGASGTGNKLTVTFDYFLAGGRVFLPKSDNAAAVTITNGTITEMTLCFRAYAADAETMLLPERQTLAAGGDFRLGYSDAGGGVASPFWYAAEGEK